MYKFKFSKKLLSFFLCFVLGFGSNIGIAIANNPTEHHLTIEQKTNPNSLEDRGKQAYRLAHYQQARDLWQQAAQIYRQEGDVIAQARVISYLALVHYQLKNETAATTQIQQSRKLLASQNPNSQLDPTLAQVLNNQGIIELAFGKNESAISSWDGAIAVYQRIGDERGVIQARLNQAKGYKTIGLYRRAVERLAEVNKDLETQPDSQLKIVGLRRYGNILRIVGDIEQSRSQLQASLTVANSLSLPFQQVETLLALGNTLTAYGEIKDKSYYQVASQHYQKGIDLCRSFDSCFETDLLLRLNLAQLNLLLKTELWAEGIDLVNTIKQQFPPLIEKDQIDLKIAFANNLIKLRTLAGDEHSSAIPSWAEITAFLKIAIADAEQLNHLQAASYGWGLQGHVREILSQWDAASDATIKALQIAQTINAPEIGYLWQWQLGRIDRARGNLQDAIAHYRQGITLLDTLSQDLANIDSNIQYSFRDSIEPIYRETVALLLDVPPGATVSQDNLIQARDTIESLQIAQLQNFFREACLRNKSVSIDSVDERAAALYPIILSDRLELILSLPNRPLIHYSIAIEQTELAATIEQLRTTVVIRSRRNYYEPATKLYHWLITPILDELAKQQIETLVFVPDGVLRNVPMAALYDGKNFLIEQYNVVFNPGLQLLNPRPLTKTKLKTLAVGLTQERDNFSALEYVNLELAQIQQQVKSEILVDEQFTTEALQEEIKFSDYPIVHIATHGQFGSSLENTFLLAWNDRINIEQLKQILQTKTRTTDAIELLVLSACETASGDERAALGLAGMAIQAGARSTIATFWSINDRATAQLMNTFYKAIATKSLGKAEAIRQAQLSLLHDPQYEHPFYWAAYTAIGNWL